MMTDEIDSNGDQGKKKFCCLDCFAYTECDCFCDRISGHDPRTGFPIVNVSDHEWNYLYSGKGLRVDNEVDIEPHAVVDDGDATIELQISLHNFLGELGDSRTGQSARFEVAEMYGISVEKLDQLLANDGGSD